VLAHVSLALSRGAGVAWPAIGAGTGEKRVMKPETPARTARPVPRRPAHDTLPFWMQHAIDRECGGYLHCIDNDGSVVNDDKSVWIQDASPG